MKHTFLSRRLALGLAVCLLAGCGAAARETPAPADTPAVLPTATAEPTGAPSDESTDAANLNWLPYAPSAFAETAGLDGLGDAAAFAPAGEIRPLFDESWVEGRAGEDGFYRFLPRADGSASLCYLDYAAAQEIVLCSQPNCAHADESCPAWFPHLVGVNQTFPVGASLVILHGGNPAYAATLGEESLARIEVASLDGGGRREVYRFPANVQVTTMPRGGYAQDDENLYFVATTTTATATLRTLCALHAPIGALYALYDLPEQEEKILGGVGTKLVLSYSPGSYDMSKSAAELQTVVACLDLSNRTLVALFSYPYVSVAGLDGEDLVVLTTEGVLRRYSLASGKQIAETPAALPAGFDPQNMHGDGLFDGKLLAHAFAVSGDGPSVPHYIAVDLQTGEAQELSAIYEGLSFGGRQPATIAAETQDALLVVCGQQEVKATLPSGETISYSPSRLALVPKADFWQNRAALTPIAWPE